MKIKHKIRKIVEQNKNRVFVDFLPKNIKLVPIFGRDGLSHLDKLAETADMIYALDIGPNFKDSSTYQFLEKYKEKIVTWYDHHAFAWPAEILQRHSSFLDVKDAESCCEIVAPVDFADVKFKSKKILIAFGRDCDGIASVCALLDTRRTVEEFWELPEIARACDRADFHGNDLAKTFHDALFVSRSDEVTNLFIRLYFEGIFNKSKAYYILKGFQKKHEEKFLNKMRTLVAYSKMWNGICICDNRDTQFRVDFTSLSSYVWHKYKCKTLIVIGGQKTKICTRDKDIDLSQIIGGECPFKAVVINEMRDISLAAICRVYGVGIINHGELGYQFFIMNQDGSKYASL